MIPSQSHKKHACMALSFIVPLFFSTTTQAIEPPLFDPQHENAHIFQRPFTLITDFATAGGVLTVAVHNQPSQTELPYLKASCLTVSQVWKKFLGFAEQKLPKADANAQQEIELDLTDVVTKKEGETEINMPAFHKAVAATIKSIMARKNDIPEQLSIGTFTVARPYRLEHSTIEFMVSHAPNNDIGARMQHLDDFESRAEWIDYLTRWLSVEIDGHARKHDEATFKRHIQPLIYN